MKFILKLMLFFALGSSAFAYEYDYIIQQGSTFQRYYSSTPTEVVSPSANSAILRTKGQPYLLPDDDSQKVTRACNY